MSELDDKAIKAARIWYTANFNGMPNTANIVEGVVTAYLGALTPQATTVGVTQDVAALVRAARVVAFEDQSPPALRALDTASEAFADRVPWNDEPAPVVPTEIETLTRERDEAIRLARDRGSDITVDVVSTISKMRQRNEMLTQDLAEARALIGIRGAEKGKVVAYALPSELGWLADPDHLGEPRLRGFKFEASNGEKSIALFRAPPAPTSERVQALENALKPFADVLDEGEGVDGVVLTFTAPDGHQVVTALPGDAFHAARAALQP